MKEVAVYEAKTRLSELLEEVAQGEQVTITRRGQPIARLVGLQPSRRAATSQRQSVAATFARLRSLRRGIVLDEDLQSLVEEGRD